SPQRHLDDHVAVVGWILAGGNSVDVHLGAGNGREERVVAYPAAQMQGIVALPRHAGGARAMRNIAMILGAVLLVATPAGAADLVSTYSDLDLSQCIQTD